MSEIPSNEIPRNEIPRNEIRRKEPTMKSRVAFYIVGTVLLLSFAGFSYSKFTETLTPYVSYEDALQSKRQVQVAGGLLKGSSSYEENGGYLHFTLTDTVTPEKTMKVRYHGVKPANFEDAISIVAIGTYDPALGALVAKDLLVKCPSKYQGIEGYEEKDYKAGEAGKA